MRPGNRLSPQSGKIGPFAERRFFTPHPLAPQYYFRMRLTFGFAAASALVLSGISLPAFAAEIEEISALLTAEALSGSSDVLASPELLAQLEDSVEVALESGVIEPEVITAAESVIDQTGDEIDLPALLEENRVAQETLWEEERDVVIEAFASVEEEFVSCRGAAAGCSDDFSERFRSTWIVKEQERIAALSEDIEALEGAERDAAVERLTSRIERFDALSAQAPGETRGRSGSTPGSSGQDRSQGNSGGQSEQQGNSSNPGQSKKSADEATPGESQGSSTPDGPSDTDSTDSSSGDTNGNSSSNGNQGGSSGKGGNGKSDEAPGKGNGKNQE